MKATQAHVIYSPSSLPREKLLPYLVVIPESGPIGDRLNTGPSATGVRFPEKASGRFQYKKNAEEVCKQFIHYARKKIQDAANGYIPPCHDPNAAEKNPRRPSYFLWT